MKSFGRGKGEGEGGKVRGVRREIGGQGSIGVGMREEKQKIEPGWNE